MRHLRAQRARMHQLLAAEGQRYPGGTAKVAIGGFSQGGCVALDAAATFEGPLGGAYCGHGQLYSVTPLARPLPSAPLRVLAFHGSADQTISVELAQSGWQRLQRAGAEVLPQVALGMPHCDITAQELDGLAAALQRWGVAPPPAAAPQ
eukprot:TRINITY_DN34036_c0_g1_i2.p2 TRINITY_DN34036_c0_g1~~TRINITY_DN34036_c0_g1_i2.p2  ORF type:complete len:149 (+),score=25.27 TRINITY_DN34036_c0_g1_i2:499-945(+)